MKKCPYCAEEIQDAAIKCKHCGASLLSVPPSSGSPRKKGSSCVVIVICCIVAIPFIIGLVGFLSAIIIPNLMRARINANESAIKSDLRTLSSASESYRAAQNTPSYPADIAALASANPPYLDESWLQSKHGYQLVYASSENKFTALAVPSVPNQTAVNTYCVDQTGVIVGSVDASNLPEATANGCIGGVAER